MSAAVDAYVAHLRASGKKLTTIDTVRFRLRGLLRTTDRDVLLRSMSRATARALFIRRAADISGETQHGELGTVSTFMGWCLEQGWIKSDPFAGIQPTAPRAAGKPQLRIDEARRFVDAALHEGTDEGLAAALTILMGLRASEVSKRVVRDVDDGARVLWVEKAKTKAGNRALEVPEVLRAPLAALVAGRGGGEPLWRSSKRDRHWIYRHVLRLCKLAGVPPVSPHGMRGTWSSIATEATPVDQVARALGHAGPSITRRHYLGSSAEQNGQQRAALRVLAGGAAGTGG